MQTANAALSTYEKRNFTYAKSIFLKKSTANWRIHFEIEGLSNDCGGKCLLMSRR